MRYTLSILLFWPAIAVCQTTPAPAVPGAADRSVQCRDILENALQDKNPDTRKQAAIALSLVGSTDPYQSQLEALLDDKDADVRVAAVASLSDVKNARTIAALHKALNDEVPEVSFAAARSLWSLHDPEGKKALLAILSGESKASSGYFAKQKREALRMMHTPKPMFLFALRTGAGFAPVPGLGEGVSSMQGLLSDPSVSGRATAALLLEKENDTEIAAALREALQDKEWPVRAAAVHALALRDDPAFQSDIVPLLDDKAAGVKLRAAAGYLRLGAVRNTTKLRRRQPRPVKKTAANRQP
jgi:HEAT repeat protein